MKRNNEHQIVIPLDFKVACCIYKLDMVEVLQIFIDHVTLYDIMNPTYHEGFTEASYTIAAYAKSTGKNIQISKAMKKCEALYLRNMRQIDKLAYIKKRGWKTSTKRKYANSFMENIFQSMERLHTPSDILYLNEFSSLRLSKDFCVLCEAHNCYPKEYLEYFMSRISLADAYANEGIKGYANFVFALFFKIGNSFGRDTPLRFELTDLEIDFYKRMEDFRLEVYIIRDPQEREATVREFYFSHYQTMNPNQI